jgi:hypothetical protein
VKLHILDSGIPDHEEDAHSKISEDAGRIIIQEDYFEVNSKSRKGSYQIGSKEDSSAKSIEDSSNSGISGQ